MWYDWNGECELMKRKKPPGKLHGRYVSPDKTEQGGNIIR